MRTDTSPYRTHQPLTAKQQLILDFITRGTARGIAPTIREIGQQFGIRHVPREGPDAEGGHRQTCGEGVAEFHSG
jgi:hypothetical protein